MAKRVLVTGGSVSANCLVWWLLEGGFEVVVVEKASKFRDGGQSIDLRGAGTEVVDRMGLKDEIDRAGTGETAWTFVDEDGNEAAAFRVADVGAEGPTAGLEILRGDLAGVFYAQVKDRVDYRFGDHVAAIENRVDDALVRFDSGKEERFDLILVAEGVGSSTRELLFEGENEPRWMDITIAYFTIPRGAGDSTDAKWFNAPSGRVIFLRPDPHGNTRAVLMIKEEVRKTRDFSEDEAKVWLRDQFADVGWEAERVLDGLDTSDDVYFEVLRQVKMDRWSDGRVALTGDAAWCATPISGIGTTLAVVGAYVLAGELAKCDRHYEAFANYERIMRPFIDEGQSVSKANQLWTHPNTRFGIAVQHTVLGILSKPVIRDIFLKLGMRESNKIDLPDYSFGKVPADAEG